MADAITIKALQDASLDVKSLEEVVNGDENVVVTTRLGETYPSVKSVLGNAISKLGFITSEADRAEAAADASTAAGRIYETSDDGQADGELVDGDYFWVESNQSGGVLELWRKGASTPTDTGKRTVSSRYVRSVRDAAFTRVYTPEWVSGTVSNATGEILTNRPARIRMADHMTRMVGSVSVSVSDPEQVCRVVTWDDQGGYLGTTELARSHVQVPVNGAFTVVVQWADDSTTITPDQGTARITLEMAEPKAQRVRQLVLTGIIDLDFEQGTRNTTTGEKSSSTANRIRTARTTYLDGILNIRMAADQLVDVYTFDESGSFLGRTDYRESITGLRVSGSFDLVVIYADERNLLPQESTAVVRTEGYQESVDNLINTLSYVQRPPVVQGSYSAINGEFDASDLNRVCTPFRYKFSGNVSASVQDAEQELRILRYDKEGNFLDGSPYEASIPSTQVDGYYALNAKWRGGMSLPIVPEDVVFETSELGPSRAESLSDLPSSSEGLPGGSPWNDKLKVSIAKSYPKEYTGSIYTNFPDHAAIYAYMDALVDDYGDYVTREEIGRSGLDMPLYMYRLKPASYTGETSNGFVHYPLQAIAAPKIILVGITHGVEHHSGVANLLYINELCRNWKDYPDLEEIRWGAEILFVPVLNPDGYDLRKSWNANDVNLNRDFGAMQASETQALVAVINDNLDAIACIDHHRHRWPNGRTIWVSVSGNETLGISISLINHMLGYTRRQFSFFPQDNSSWGRLTRPIDTTVSGWAQKVAGINSYLLETADSIGNDKNGFTTILHAREAVGKLISLIFRREVAKRELFFEEPSD